MTLNPQQTGELRRLIAERREALIAELRADVARAREAPFAELAGAAPDSGDESVAGLLRDLDQFDVSRDLTELRGLEAARERLASGRYGVCVGCGADIGYARLLASPGAARCIACQQLHEKTHAGTGRPTL